MIRGGSAAASQRGSAVVGDFPHAGSEFFRPDIKHGLPQAVGPRQSRIGIDQQRYGDDFTEPLCDFCHLSWTQGTVESEAVDAKAFHHHRGAFTAASGKKLPAFIKGHGQKDRKITVLLGRKHRGLGFQGIVHGFDHHKIGSGLRPGPYHFRKCLHRIFKGEISHRLQQLSARPDIQCHIGILFSSGKLSCLCCVGYRGEDDFFDLIVEMKARGAEGIGVYDMASGLIIGTVQCDDFFGMGKIPEIRVFPGFQASCLQDRSAAAVKKQAFLSDSFHQGFSHDVSLL